MSLADFLYTVHKDRRRREIGQQMAERMGYELDPSGLPIVPSSGALSSPAAMPGMHPMVGGNEGAAAGAQEIYMGLVNRGMPPHIAAGFAGNLQVESGFNPTAFNEGEQAYGLGQWRGDRFNALTSTYGNAPSVDQQLDFIIQELGGTEGKAWERISQAQTPAEAAALIDQYYERSSGEHRSRRTSAADAIYGQYGGEQPFSADMASAAIDRAEGVAPTLSTSGAPMTSLGPAAGVSTPFSQGGGAVPGSQYMPDPRLPHDFAQMGMMFLSQGYFQEAMQLLSPMQQYAVNSNIMRSEYSINSTLTEQAHQARMTEIDAQQDRIDFRHTTPSADALLSDQLARDKMALTAGQPPQIPNHLVTPYMDLTARQDVAINAVDTINRAIAASRDPMMFRGGELRGEEQALVRDLERLAIQDARIANGGAEPNQEQIETAMKAYGYDPARRRFTGAQAAQEERLIALRDRWAKELSNTETQFGVLGLNDYRDAGRKDTVTKILRDERRKAADTEYGG